jgi:hypothetical protein
MGLPGREVQKEKKNQSERSGGEMPLSSAQELKLSS